MSISSLFTRIGAPLCNSRQSWGARRASDGAVILRVWQDLKFIDEAHCIYIMLSGIQNAQRLPFGAKERMQHITRIRARAPCFLVMCEAKDAEISERQIKDFDERLFVGGAIIDTPPGFVFPPQTSAKTRQLAEYGAIWVHLGPRASPPPYGPRRSTDPGKGVQSFWDGAIP